MSTTAETTIRPDASQAEQAEDLRTATINGLHDYANFLAMHPAVPIPYDVRTGLTEWVSTRKEFASAAAALGATGLDERGSQVFVFRMFGPVRVEVGISRDRLDTVEDPPPPPPPVPALGELLAEVSQ